MRSTTSLRLLIGILVLDILGLWQVLDLIKVLIKGEDIPDRFFTVLLVIAFARNIHQFFAFHQFYRPQAVIVDLQLNVQEVIRLIQNFFLGMKADMRNGNTMCFSELLNFIDEEVKIVEAIPAIKPFVIEL